MRGGSMEIKKYFVTADLEWFVTGYPNDYCNISNHEFPLLIPDPDEADRVAGLANEQNPGMTFAAATIVARQPKSGEAR